MLAGKGDLLPVSAFPVDGTWPTGTAQWEKRNIALEIPVWDPTHLHPVQQVRAGLPARRHPRQGLRRRARSPARPTTFKSTALKAPELQGLDATRSRSRPRTAPAAALCVEVCPAKDKAEPAHKAIDMAPQPPLRERGAGQLRLLPRPARGRTARRSARARRQELAVPAAAVRVLGRLRRLRRDAVPQAAHPALRRPRCSSPTPPAARRSTAATCRPRPTRVNRDGRGPAWSNSLFEDNAEFGLACAWRSTSTAARRARCSQRAARRDSATSSARELLERRPVERGRASPRSASASRRCASGCAAHRRRRGAGGSTRWPTTS